MFTGHSEVADVPAPWSRAGKEETRAEGDNEKDVVANATTLLRLDRTQRGRSGLQGGEGCGSHGDGAPRLVTDAATEERVTRWKGCGSHGYGAPPGL